MAKVSVKHQYTIAVNDVFRFFSDEATVAAKHEKLGAIKYRLKAKDESGSTLNVDSRREVPVGLEVPAALRKFAGEYNKVRQRETWTLHEDGSRSCKLRIDLDGLPVKIQGEMVITPTEQGCVNNVDMEINSSLPLIGKMAADFVGKSIQMQMEGEYDYIKNA